MKPFKKIFICLLITVSVLLFNTVLFAQTENIRGVRLKDGSVIYGTITEMNVYKVVIVTKDKEIITKNFDDVESFIKAGSTNNIGSEVKPTKAMTEGNPSDTSFYVSMIGGVSFPSDMPSTINVSGVGYLTGDTKLKTGWLAGAKFGYLIPFSNRILVAELEYNHIANDSDAGHIYALGETLGSSIKTDAFMFNLIARFPTGKFHPYIGAGAGYANIAVDNAQLSLSGVGTANISSGSQGVFAYQFLTGIDYDIAKNWFAGIGYKYFAASKASYNATASAVIGSAPASVDVEYKSSILTFSFGYLFYTQRPNLLRIVGARHR